MTTTTTTTTSTKQSENGIRKRVIIDVGRRGRGDGAGGLPSLTAIVRNRINVIDDNVSDVEAKANSISENEESGANGR